VLVSDETWSAAKRTDGVSATPHDDVKIRGRAKAVRVWQLA